MLTDVDVYDIYTHGAIAAISIDDGNVGDNLQGIQHMFYAGEKDLEEKANMTKGFAHIVAMLEIDAEVLEAKRAALEAEAEQQRLIDLRKEVEAEIKAEAEREALKKQILEEMKASGELDAKEGLNGAANAKVANK